MNYLSPADGRFTAYYAILSSPPIDFLKKVRKKWGGGFERMKR